MYYKLYRMIYIILNVKFVSDKKDFKKRKEQKKEMTI